MKVEKKNGYIYFGKIQQILSESIKFTNREGKLMLIDCTEISTVQEVDFIRPARKKDE